MTSHDIFEQSNILNEERKIIKQQKAEMCITFFCMRPSSDKSIKLIIGFNRDEQSHRETLAFGPFSDDPNIYAGRDVPTQGTWLGFNIKTGIMIILTNYDLQYNKQGKSRGKAVRMFLDTSFIPEHELSSQQFIDAKIRAELEGILKSAGDYKAFNMLAYNMRSESMFYACTENGMQEVYLVEKHKCQGLCNSDLHTLWPKTKYGLDKFTSFVQHIGPEIQDFQLLKELNEKIMIDETAFTEDPNDESSIFIKPFFSSLQNAQRETKQTFLAVIRDSKEASSISLQELTYHQGHIHTVQLSLTL